jgi:hypothetical protein
MKLTLILCSSYVHPTFILGPFGCFFILKGGCEMSMTHCYDMRKKDACFQTQQQNIQINIFLLSYFVLMSKYRELTFAGNLLKSKTHLEVVTKHFV